jgi:ribulose-5-phosphate 4-epimerase/fuculose-1-phosphate aldolase
VTIETLIPSEESRQRDLLAALGRSLFERGLTAGSSGNLSVRLADSWLLTPTNACLGRLEPARIARLDWNGRLLAGDPPSKEAPLHQALYLARPRAGAIVHLHSTHAAAVSCLAGLDPADCIPPLTPYFVMKIGRLPLVPYHRPGDPAVAAAIAALAERHTAVLLANHGPVVSAPDLESALYAAEELEETARLHLLLRGSPARPLDAAQIDQLRSTFGLEL